MYPASFALWCEGEVYCLLRRKKVKEKNNFTYWDRDTQQSLISYLSLTTSC